ncbi:unnamed protein product, partial [Porites lobata]
MESVVGPHDTTGYQSPSPFGPPQGASLRELNMKAPTFPKGFAGGSTGMSIVQDAPINTSASTVESPILSPDASNQDHPRAMGKNLLLPTTEALPTPVRVKRLLFYLEGYDAHCYKELLSGFV